MAKVKLELLANNATNTEIIDHINRLTKEIEYNLNNIAITTKEGKNIEVKLVGTTLSVYQNGTLKGTVTLV